MFDLRLLYMSLNTREKINIIRLEETDSTNLYAKRNLAQLPDRSVVSASCQTHGRGRFDRAWVDLGAGNIFMSVILKPSDTFIDVYSNLTQYFSVCICRVLEVYGLNPTIKWPNDVLIDGKKIAGILSETVMQGKIFNGLILGVGINLNASREDIKLITDKAVAALNLELNRPVDKEEFLQKLLFEFFAGYDEFLNKGFKFIKEDYLSKAIFLGKEISVKIFDGIKSGIAKEITDSGELVLANNFGDTILTMGDIL